MAVLLAALLLALASIGAAPAGAAAPLSWSAAPLAGAHEPTAVACPSEGLCVAVDKAGDVLASTDPTASAPAWSAAAVDPGHALDSVACASTALCVAVDRAGDVLASRDPTGGAPAWASATIDSGHPLTAVSCAPASSLCVAVDGAGSAFATGDPTAGAGAWAQASIDGGRELTAISCPGTALCVAADGAGSALASTLPTGGAGAWRARAIDPALAIRALSCAPGSSICLAVDSSGNALASPDPGAGAPTWSSTPIDPNALAGVSCAGSGLCVAVDQAGGAVASDDPTSALPAWSESSADPGGAPAGISCLAGGFCLAVDSSGRALSGRVPPPHPATLPPAEVSAAGAVLSGTVDPNDATLESCAFEYGPTGSYGLSAACSSLPAPAGGTQVVGATVTGLAPNTTYHYRLLAASPAGAGAGGDVAFTTAVSASLAIVHPHPSISGVPAIGRRLTCQSGVSSSSGARLAYAWLRDQVAIAGATGSSYVIAGTDAGHHLQCRVTATDGGGSATATSAFVTVPASGATASAGETRVGRAGYRKGRVYVPITCSPEAPSGCRLLVSLTVTETLRAGRVVALGARSAAVRRVTVSLGAARLRLARGERRTASLPLNATGRHLLAGRRTLAAELSVYGTVIGVIEAPIAQQRLVLDPPRRPTARAASVRRAGAAGVLAPTPYMGWDTYFAFGGSYSEATVLAQASDLISLGLQREGYRYVWLDVGWWQGVRAADGQITVSRAEWPHGLAWLTRTLHDAGFRVGLYTDAGPNGCGGAGQGSLGHYQQDVDTFAAWGFDAVKVDFCGGFEARLNPAVAYGAFHAAIAANSSRRPMLLSICNFLQPGQAAEGEPPFDESAFSSYAFGPTDGNSWRTDTDVGFPGQVTFAEVLRNMDADAADPQAAGPGHWNDPDYLGADQGLTAAQFRTQLSMWSILAAPLMISDNLASISAASRAALEDTEVIAIDQDPAGIQGTLLSSSREGEVWVKPLGDGSRAVALLNRGASPLRISTSAPAAGMPPAGRYAVRNVWTHTTSTTRGPISAEVPGDSTVLLRVSAE